MRLGDDPHLGLGEPGRIGPQVGPYAIIGRHPAFSPPGPPGPPGAPGEADAVYLAEHAVLETRRTVRVLAARRTQDEVAVRRLVHDLRAAARLRHRHLVAIHDVGQLANGAWFVVLDELEGAPLAQLMAGHVGPMPLDHIVHLVCEIASGHGIVHRDLTPDCVFVRGCDGDPRRVGVVLGLGSAGDEPSPYRAPEQLPDAAVGPAADVFALGVIAYQMATGGWFPHQYGESRAGYGELSAAELYRRQVAEPPVDPRARFQGLSAAWAGAIVATLDADPARRPASAAAFALDLAAALPASGAARDGRAIVQAYAPELLLAGTAGTAGAAAGPEIARPVRPPSRPSLSIAELGARYRIGDRLGAGGMAEVFSATMIGAEGFARRVAIKRVLPGLSQIPAFAAMFVAEARIASRLSHPNIVSVLDFARDAEQRLYLVMEYVDGKDLASLLATGAIEPGLAIFVLVELLHALGYAHDLPEGDALSAPAIAGDAAPAVGTGVIHRDISPQNLLLGYEGAVKISDFGLAKVRAASGCVRSETVRGKPSYMSPEQAAGDPLDGRSDLYAAGVMLWEMLADRPLFTGTPREIVNQVMFRGVAPPSRFRGAVPADLEAVAMTLLACRREDRYPTAGAAIEALLRCADAPRDGRGALVRLLAARFPAAGGRGPRGIVAASEPRGRDPVTVAAPPSAAVVPSAAAAARASVPARPHRRVFAATLGMAILCAAVVGAVLMRGEVARSQTPERGARPSEARSALPALPAPPAPPASAPADAGVAAIRDAARPASPAIAPSGDAAPRPAHRERARDARTGELAIIVRPWAMIWLNGKPSGQTPFRAAVPVGRYRVRLANDDVGRHEITTVTVEPDQTATVERRW